MLNRVLVISLMGMGVVFGFLFLIYLILSAFKYIFKTEEKDQLKLGTISTRTDDKGQIAEEEIASIMSALNFHHQGQLKGKQVIINKIGRVEE